MTATTIRVQMAQRSDTAANWTAANPILLSGEIGYETDTEKFKIGDGTTNWNSLAYLPIPDGSGNLTITGNLEIGTTGTLTFEGSTADGFETTLAVTDPTADRTITLPDVSGTVVTTGDTGSVTSTMIADGTIVDADVSATAEISVSKLANGTANQVLVTDGTDVSWSDDLTLAGNLTVNGTTTTVNTETLVVEDKNIDLGVVGTPTDVTADGGGITLKGTTDKTINWIDATDSWTSSEHVDLASGKSYRINGTEVLSSTTLGSGITGSSLTSVGTLGSLTVTGSVTAGTLIPTSSSAPTNGLYLPAANSVALSTSGAEALRINADGDILVADGNRMEIDEIRARDGAGLKLFDDAGAGIFVQDGGSVGIGTSSPSYTLQAAGPVASVASYGNFTALQADGGTGFRWTLNNDGTFALQSTTDGFSTASYPLYVDASNRVGIGTTSPGDTLEVSGNILLSSNSGSFRLLGAPDSSNTTVVLQGGGTSGTGGNIELDRNGDIVYDGTNHRFRNVSGASEYARIDSSGRLLVGTSSSVSTHGFGSQFQLVSTTNAYQSNIAFRNDQFAPFFNLCHSRGASIGTHTILQNNDAFGVLSFMGSDGSTFIRGAEITGYVDGTPGTDDMPGRLVFSSNPGAPATSPAEAMRINSAQELLIGYTSDNGAYKLQVNSQIFATSATIATSDGRYKENVATLDGCVDLVKALRPVSFDWKHQEPITRINEEGETVVVREAHNFPDGTQVGFIAQEVETVLADKPWLGSIIKQNVRPAVTDADGNELAPEEDFLGIAEGNLVAVLTSALKDAIGRIESLEAEVAALKA